MSENTLLTKEKTGYFYLLRILAVLSVVLCHSAAGYWYSFEETTSSWKALCVFDGIARWGSMNFLMISGALFLDPDRDVPAKKIFTKSIPKILAAYVIWALVYAFYNCHGVLDKKAILTCFVEGEYHMWYLNMLLGMYLITPLLRLITAKKESTEYFLIISFVFTFIIPLILTLLRVFDEKNIIDFSFYNIFCTAYDKMYFRFAVGYPFYYVLGYWLHKSDISRKAEIIIYILGVIGFAATVGLMIGIGNADDPYELYSKFSLNVLFEAAAVFVFAKQRLSRLIKTGSGLGRLKKVSALTFGVYLMHPLIADILYYSFGFDASKYNVLWSIPVLFAAVAVLSFFFSWILKKIPFVKDWAL